MMYFLNKVSDKNIIRLNKADFCKKVSGNTTFKYKKVVNLVKMIS